MRKISLIWIGLSLALTLGHATADESAPVLDRSIKPVTDDSEPNEEVSSVFRDMGVVQRKAMSKSQKLLLSPYFSMDFSDGPYTMYGVNIDIGYAISDFWEIYINTTPFFINNQRSIVKKVEALDLPDSQTATISAPLAKRQLGIELLWAPLYGKDSLGARTVIRSDTFFKIGVMQIFYVGDTGLKFHAGIGKSYFFSKRFGFRITAAGNYQQTIVGGLKSFNTAATLETGLIFYLL